MSRDAALDRRMRRLAQLAAASSSARSLDEQARSALTRVWKEGSRPPAILIRSSFIAHRSPLVGEMSDSSLPIAAERPPMGRLPSPRGLALKAELVALFVAQCGGGRRTVAQLPIEAAEDGVGWRNLLMSVAEHQVGKAVRATTATENRIRQIKKAFDRLADPSIGLVVLPNAGTTRSRYSPLRLLNEGGMQPEGEASRYVVPRPGAHVVSVPPEFFVNGWIHALEDSEIAAWLMFRHAAADGDASVSGQTRISTYGLPVSTWAKHRMLRRYLLMDFDADENRREDGTMEDRNAHGDGKYHRFHLTDDGLNAVAVHAVLAGLAAERDADPD